MVQSPQNLKLIKHTFLSIFNCLNLLLLHDLDGIPLLISLLGAAVHLGIVALIEVGT